MSIERVFTEIEGWFFEGEARMMNRRAAEIEPPNCIVEIGSYRGKSTCALALHSRVPVYAIDPHVPSDDIAFGDEDRAIFARNTLEFGLAGKIRPINLPSLEVAKVWTAPIGLLFIDGDHQQAGADLAAWLPFVVDGGQVAFHDNNRTPILQAVAGRDDLVEVERSDLTVVYVKEHLYEEYTYDGLTMWVRRGPYNKDDKYVLGEVRSYDIGERVPRTVLDIGGHIGAFSAWIHALHPQADIVAVEPEPSGYAALSKNLGPRLGVENVLHARVGYEASGVLFVDPVNSGSHRVVSSGDVIPGKSYIPAPPSVTIGEIMASKGWETIDLLKIDCEGCEEDVLLNCPAETLSKVGRIVGEFHAGYEHFMETIAHRLMLIGFDIVGNQDPLGHATFVAVNANVLLEVAEKEQAPDEEPIQYGVPVDWTHPKPVRKPATKKPAKKGRR